MFATHFKEKYRFNTVYVVLQLHNLWKLKFSDLNFHEFFLEFLKLIQNGNSELTLIPPLQNILFDYLSTFFILTIIEISSVGESFWWFFFFSFRILGFLFLFQNSHIDISIFLATWTHLFEVILICHERDRLNQKKFQQFN